MAFDKAYMKKDGEEGKEVPKADVASHIADGWRIVEWVRDARQSKATRKPKKKPTMKQVFGHN